MRYTPPGLLPLGGTHRARNAWSRTLFVWDRRGSTRLNRKDALRPMIRDIRRRFLADLAQVFPDSGVRRAWRDEKNEDGLLRCRAVDDLCLDIQRDLAAIGEGIEEDHWSGESIAM